MNSKIIGTNKYFVLKFILVYIIISALTNFYASAQLGNGCYVGGILHTTKARSGAYFYRSPNLDSDCGFVRTGSSLGSCRLYNSGSIYLNSSYTNYTNSYSSNWREINCPIDNEVWLLLFVVSGFSIFRIKSFIKV